MIERYKKIPDLPTGSPMDEDLIPFVKLSTNQTMKAPKASLMGAQAIAVAFVDNDMVFTLTNGMEISILNAKLQLRGETGDEVQIRKTSTHLQWKLTESEEWNDIVSLAEITGPKGDVGANIVGAGFNGNDLVFILDDASTLTIVDGRLAIKGDKGDTGDAGLVTIGTVTTLPAGSPATVENTGTSKDAILNFGIPEGHDGDMQKSTYDPNNKNGDAFDMDNMSEGATNKILTAGERANFHAPGSDDQDLSSLIPKSIGTADGDIIYFTDNATPARLAKGTDGQVLTMVSDLPAWDDPSGSVPEAGVAVSNGSDWGASLQVIDPDNITPQSAGYLVGGTGHSALSVFQALGAGANNGKFKINVDGNVYDNLGIDLLPPTNINVGGTGSAYGLYGHTCGQSFTLTKETYVTQIGLYTNRFGSGSNFNFVMNLYAANEDGSKTGPVLATVTINVSNPPYLSGWQYLTVNQSLPAGKYHLECPQSYQSYSWYAQVYYNTSSYSGGSAFYDGVVQAGNNLYMSVQVNSTISLSSIAESIQSAIRTATGNAETVIYDTNHYKIKSAKLGRDSKILKLMSPSTGTDISGAGAIPYLDMASNATEVFGTGEDYNLVRLDEDGKIVKSLVQYKKTSGVTTRDLATASGTQTIAHGLGEIPKKIRLTGLKGAGAGITYETSQGLYDNGANKRIYASNVYAGQSTTSAIYFRPSNSGTEQSQTGVVTVDATNITITWTKLNSPDGTAQILWEAEI